MAEINGGKEKCSILEENEGSCMFSAAQIFNGIRRLRDRGKREGGILALTCTEWVFFYTLFLTSSCGHNFEDIDLRFFVIC